MIEGRYKHDRRQTVQDGLVALVDKADEVEPRSQVQVELSEAM